jgi:hypothetical protein
VVRIKGLHSPEIDLRLRVAGRERRREHERDTKTPRSTARSHVNLLSKPAYGSSGLDRTVIDTFNLR